MYLNKDNISEGQSSDEMEEFNDWIECMWVCLGDRGSRKGKRGKKRIKKDDFLLAYYWMVGLLIKLWNIFERSRFDGKCKDICFTLVFVEYDI